MLRLVPFPTLVATLLALGCAAPKPALNASADADERAIRAIDDRWNQALKSQDDSLIGGIYASDAVLLPPNMPRVSGTASIRQFWAQIWPLKATLQLQPGTIRVSGDWAIEEGNWTWSLPTPAGETRDTGKYLVSWHRESGGWRAVEDIWNSDNPPPPAAATNPAKPAK
jgi:uncharacterized protein (TIGR02246 family)